MKNLSQVDRLMLALKVNGVKELAGLLGVAQNTVSTWKARGKIPADQQIAASQIAKCELLWLRDGTEPMRAEKSADKDNLHGMVSEDPLAFLPGHIQMAIRDFQQLEEADQYELIGQMKRRLKDKEQKT